MTWWAGIARWLMPVPALAWHLFAPGIDRVDFPLRPTGPLSHVEVIALRVHACALVFTSERRTVD